MKLVQNLEQVSFTSLIGLVEGLVEGLVGVLVDGRLSKAPENDGRSLIDSAMF